MRIGKLRCDKVFFTGCTHYGHANVIRFCDRPFVDIAEHDEALIANHNSVVSPDDTVIHLGDAWFFKRDGTSAPKMARAVDDRLLSRLNGKFVFVHGNHDNEQVMSSARNNIAKVRMVLDVAEFTLTCDSDMPPGQPYIFASHYPHLFWNRSHHGSWHIFSHVHGALDDPDPENKHHSTLELNQPFDISKRLMVDVGVDANNYTPVSYWQLKAKMAAKTWVKPPRT